MGGSSSARIPQYRGNAEGDECCLLARSGGSRKCRMMPAMEGEADGRRTQPAQPHLTRSRSLTHPEPFASRWSSRLSTRRKLARGLSDYSETLIVRCGTARAAGRVFSKAGPNKKQYKLPESGFESAPTINN
jgi:hypothetical protein